MGATEALIFGDFALHFMEGASSCGRQMHLIVQEGKYFDRMRSCLLQQEDYQATTSYDILEDDSRKNFSVTAFERRGSQIRLYSAAAPPNVAILYRLESTALGNIISWNRAYSLFPRMTFDAYETVPLQPLQDQISIRHRSLSIKGWRTTSYSWIDYMEQDKLIVPRTMPREFAQGKHGKGYRRLGDGLSWVLHLDTAAVPTPPTISNLLEYTSMRLFDASSDDTLNTTVGTAAWSTHWALLKGEVLKAHCLRHEWSIAPDLTVRSVSIHDELDWKFRRESCTQLLKMDVADRVALFQCEEPHYSILEQVKFDKPDGWDYHDHVIPEYVHMAEQELVREQAEIDVWDGRFPAHRSLYEQCRRTLPEAQDTGRRGSWKIRKYE
ncbi:Hypothetical protein D9617_1g083590 [Elsinoe fawcettii]|nr:Hypothetical protein D9617_1g083590 [Elsinoe fawcettii]